MSTTNRYPTVLSLAHVVRQRRGARVDIVVPVHNEQNALERSIRHLHGFLATSLPFDWRIVIVDNASVDQTDLSTDDPDSRVKIVRTALGDLRGVGRLLWQTPPARSGRRDRSRG